MSDFNDPALLKKSACHYVGTITDTVTHGFFATLVIWTEKPEKDQQVQSIIDAAVQFLAEELLAWDRKQKEQS